MSAMMHPRTIVRMVVVMVAASRQHQQQRSADNGNNQLSHVSLILSCPHIIAHFHAGWENRWDFKEFCGIALRATTNAVGWRGGLLRNHDAIRRTGA